MQLNLSIRSCASLFRFTINFSIVIVSLTISVQAQQLPIQQARTISFETTEGTYMDVDLSPDGTTIAFDLLGDIYTLSVTGGIANQLTRGLAINCRPVWSPDGKRIAYVSDISGARHLNVMDAKGKFLRTLGQSEPQLDNIPSKATIADEEMPVWAPNGSYISIAGHLYNIAGGGFSLQPQTEGSIQFSSDGRLLFSQNNNGMHQHNWKTDTTTLVANLPEDYTNARISPDNHWLIYTTKPKPGIELRVRDLFNGQDRSLVPLIERSRAFSERYTFTTDSRCLIIGFGGKLHMINIQTGEDQIIPFKAKVKIDLGHFDYNTFRVTHNSLTVRYTRSSNSSPDGHQLVFSALDRIYVMELPKGIPHPLVNQSMGQFQPMYSPDGKWIAYVTWSDTAGGQLWRVSAAGGRPIQLTHVAGHYQAPAWSPDGKLLAIVKNTPILSNTQASQLQLISVSGGLVRVLTDSIPLRNQLSFSSDGTRLAFMPKDDNSQPNNMQNPQLISLQLDGKNQQVLAVSRGNVAGLSQITISPDGRYLVYMIRDDLYLEPLTGLGQPAVIGDEKQMLPVIRFAKGGLILIGNGMEKY
jgi:Tol biopolymer transport system component